jgi:hypothetical protein
VLLFAGIVIMVALLDIGAGLEIVTWPMLLAGLGVGALASQLGSARSCVTGTRVSDGLPVAEVVPRHARRQESGQMQGPRCRGQLPASSCRTWVAGLAVFVGAASVVVGAEVMGPWPEPKF